jgi:hypothetical protein
MSQIKKLKQKINESKEIFVNIHIYTLMSRSASSSRVGSGVPFGGSANGVRGPTFQSGGHTISSNTGFLANPSRAAQHAANNAGALTRFEANSIGLHLAGRPSRALPGFPK